MIPSPGKRRLPSKLQNAPNVPVSRQRLSRAFMTNQPSPPGRRPNFVLSSGASGATIHRLTDVQKSLPVAERPRRPEWMKVRAPSADSRYFDVKKLIHGQNLLTICEEARCPNIAECWGRGTATFQILGETCTRACRYCYVHSGKPEHPPDPLEPLRLAHTAAQMSLKHVVVTSVDRDDLPDKGAAHYAATIRALKAKVPGATIEVLTPDFLGYEEQALQIVLAERPDVFNHNIETVRRLHRKMRGAKVDFDRALWLLERAKVVADYPVLTKSGIIVGLGETNDEVVETMRELRGARRRRGHDRPVPPAVREARADRPLGAPRRVPLVPRAGRGARLRLGLLGPAGSLVVSSRRAASRGRNRSRRSRVLDGKRVASGGDPLSLSSRVSSDLRRFGGPRRSRRPLPEHRP